MTLSLFKKSKKMTAGLLAAAVLVVGAGGTAYALVTNSTGTFSDRQYFATNDTAYTIPAATASDTWVNVPGMVRTVTVPTNSSRLIDARFTAESSCIGGSWCSARIVVVGASGVVSELYPRSGLDFAFDSPGTDAWEGHAIERNSRTFLPAGSYRVIVQAAKRGNSTFRLDDMHLAVEAVRP